MEKGKVLEEIPNWFPGARLNYAENLLIRKDDGVALTEANESGSVVEVTFRELNERVREMAAALRANGLKIGDRVAGEHTNNVAAGIFSNSDRSNCGQCHYWCCHSSGCRERRRYLLQHCDRYGNAGKLDILYG